MPGDFPDESLGDRLGGRESLRILALFYVISALGCAFAWNWPSLLFFRFIGGLGISGSSVLGPVYIAGIAPAKWRGMLVGCFQIDVVAGSLVAYLSNYLIGLAGFGINEWRWMLGVAAGPAILFLIMLFGIPRSARWLVTKNRIPEAREVLEQLGSPDGQSELDGIIASVHVDGVAHYEPLFQRKYRLPIYLAFTVAAFNQLAGILPGSGIHINYVDAARKYAVASRIDRDMMHAGLNDIASRVKSDGVSVLVFNPLSWARTDEVEFEARFPAAVKDVTAIGSDGKSMPIEVLSNDPQTNRVKLRLLAENIPATGYKLIWLVLGALVIFAVILVIFAVILVLQGLSRRSSTGSSSGSSSGSLEGTAADTRSARNFCGDLGNKGTAENISMTSLKAVRRVPELLSIRLHNFAALTPQPSI